MFFKKKLNKNLFKFFEKQLMYILSNDIDTLLVKQNIVLSIMKKQTAIVYLLNETIAIIEMLIDKSKYKNFHNELNKVYQQIEKDNNKTVNEFYIQKLHENKLIELIYQIIEKRISFNENLTYSQNTFIVLKLSFFLMNYGQLNNSSNQNAIFLTLNKYLENYFEKFDQQDVLYNDLNDLNDLLKIKQYLYNELNRRESKQQQYIKAEKIKIKLLFLYLETQNFNKKLSCLNILDSFQQNQISKDAEILIADELLEKDIIKYLYCQNSCLELIKRTHKFVEFLAPSLKFQHILQFLDYFDEADTQKKDNLTQVLQIIMSKVGSSLLRECLQQIEQQDPNNNSNNKLVYFLVQALSQNQKGTFQGILSGLGLNLSDKQILSLREYTLNILFKNIITYNNKDRDTIDIYLQGFQSLIQVYQNQQLLEFFFTSSVTTLQNQSCSIYTLYILKYIMQEAKPKKNMIISFGSSNFDDKIIKKLNMGKAIFNIMFNYIEQLIENDLELIQVLFEMFTLLIQKFPNVIIEKQYFSQIWIYCFEFENEKLAEIFKKFILKNYANYWKKYQLFPCYFQERVIVQRPNKQLYDLFFDLMIIQNQESELLKVETKNVEDQIFAINDKIEILEGLNEIWKFYIEEQNEECSLQIRKYILNIYSSFSITDNFSNIKKYFLNFLNRQKIYLKNSKLKNEQNSVKLLLDLFIDYLNVIKQSQSEYKFESDTKNTLIRIVIDNNNNFDIWVDLEDNFLKLLQRIKNQLKIKQDLLVQLNKNVVVNFNFLRKYKIKHVEMNQENKRVINVCQSSQILSINELFDFAIKTLRTDDQIYSICDYLLNSDEFIYQETLINFLNIFSPQRNYYNYFISEFKKIPSNNFSDILQISNKKKFSFLCNLILIIIQQEKIFKDQTLTEILKKRQIANLIQFLNEIFIIEDYQFVIENNLFTLIDILCEIIDKEIELKQFQLNIQNFNKKIMQQNSIEKLTKDQKSKTKFVQLQIKFYQSDLIKYQFLVEILSMILQTESQNFDMLNLVCSITQKQDQDENLLQILKIFKEQKKNLNLFQKIFYLKIFMQGFQKEFLLGDFITTLIEEIFDEEIFQYTQKNQLKFFVQFILEISSSEFIFTDLDCDFQNVLEYLKKQFFQPQNEKNLELFNQPDFIGNFFSIFSFLINYKTSQKLTKNLFLYIFDQVKVSQYLRNWNRQVFNDIKRNNQYTGLLNLGCTCYINSAIQQLFMIKQFRKFLRLLIINEKMELLQNLEILLNSWQSTTEEFIDPKKFVDSIRMFGNEKINYSQQMDVDEFLIQFFDQIEKNLNDNFLVDIIKNFFYGQFKQEIRTQECQHRSIKYDQFVTLTLYVKNQHTLQDSLDHMIQWDNLDGVDSYECNECQQKGSVLKRLTLSVIPNFLFCVFQRFEFDFIKNTKLKIGDVIKFPFELNLSKYYFENDKEQLQKKGYFQFSLCGIIIHSGDANSGHYVSVICNDKDQWYLFNDKKVYQVDKNYIEKIAFGQKFEDNLSNSAYVLLYQRQKFFNKDKQEISDLFDVQNKKYFHDQQAVNMQMKLTSILNKNFCQHFFQQIVQQEKNDDIFQIVCVYFFKIVVRNNDVENLFVFYQSILQQIINNVKCSIYFVKQFLDFEVIQEFLIFCPNVEVKGFVTDLLIESLNVLMKEQNYQIVFIFLHVVLYSIQKVEKVYKNNLLFLLLILENLVTKKSLCKILYYFKMDLLLINLILNKESKFMKLTSKKSQFIQENDKKTKKQKFDYEVDQVIIRILFVLSQKLNLLKSKILQNEDFFDSIINYITNNHTNKKIAEFFMLCTQQNFDLIETQLYEMPINVFNFKKVFFILLEISYLNNQKIFELIVTILYKSINERKQTDLFYFDFMIKFISELCIQNQQFLDFLNSQKEYNQFIKKLLDINEYTKDLQSLQNNNFDSRHPLFYPENQLEYINGNISAFKDFLYKKYILRKRYLNSILSNSLQDIISNTAFLYYKDVRQIGISNQEYIIQNNLLFLERCQVLQKTQTMLKLKSKNLGEKWVLKENKQLLEKF